MSAENYLVNYAIDEAVVRDELLATIRVTMHVMAERYRQEIAEPLETGWNGLRNALQRWQPNDVALSAENHNARIRWRFQYRDEGGAEQTFGIASSIALPETAEGNEVKVAIQQLNTPSLSKKAPGPLPILDLQRRKDVTGKYGFVPEELRSRLGEVLPRHMNQIEVGGSTIALVTIRTLDNREYFYYDESTMLSYSKLGYLCNAPDLADNEVTQFAQDGITSAELIYDSFEERCIRQSIKETNLPTLNAVLAVLAQDTTVRYYAGIAVG